MRWSDKLWAKSPAFGATSGETLVAHTLNVVRRVARLRQRVPHLADQSGEPRFWHRLALAAATHDLGKADPRFQSMVREPRRKPGAPSSYDQRHEIVSLAWLDWILGDDPHEDRIWVAAAIASHHRDYSIITLKYNLGTVWEPSSSVQDLLAPIPDDIFPSVANLFLEEIIPEVRSSGLLADDWQSPPAWNPSPTDRQRAHDSIRQNLRCWETWMQSSPDEASRRLGLFVRGSIILADHSASAHEDFHKLEILHQPDAVRTCLAPPKSLPYYPHQDQSAACQGHAILVAPTGSGKTEAALRWAARQYAGSDGYPPLFYVLPFKASMNAMRRRLVEKLTPEDQNGERITLQHSSAMQVLYHQLMTTEDYSPEHATRLARRYRNLTQLHTNPVRVLSPFQILRAAYQLKGHEAIWTDTAGGLFIFDEIHAYQPEILGRLLEMLRFLVDRLGARAFVMTATMPKPVYDRIANILGVETPIMATPDTFAKFRRHRLVLCETGLLDDATVQQIVDRANQQQAVLCVATMVQRAQDLQRKLQAALGPGRVKLLHSRFTGEDRNALEEEVRRAVSTQNQREEREPIVLVATQVVEVSLDVDFDVLFSDPAPIEALLQRFGRVNRSRRADPHDVIVCKPVEDAHPVYSQNLVAAAIAALESADGRVIDEALVQTWIDEVYDGPIGKSLADQLDGAAINFRQRVLDVLLPFQTDPALERLFYDQFDGFEVIPRSLVDRYRTYIDSEPLLASALTVPISTRQRQNLQRKERLLNPQECGLPEKAPFVADVPYSSSSGLDLTLHRDDEST